MRDYTISELVDLPTIQNLADAVYQVTGMPIGIIDATDDSILVAVGWQDICTLFHRPYPSSRTSCEESDNYIKNHLIDGEACHYRCKNGLWDIGVPIIVAKRHLATIFLGQFFYEGETADRGRFIRQAREHGYDLSEYLAALDRVPVFTREKVDSIITYNKAFSRFLTDLAESSLRNFEAEQALKDSEYKYRVLTETSPAAVFLFQKEKIVYANPGATRMLGLGEEELRETRLQDWMPSELKDVVQNRGLTRELGASEHSSFECRFTTKSGKERWGYISTGRVEYKGNPAGLVLIQDITNQKQMEEGIRKSTEKFQAIVEAFDGFIYTCSDDYRIEFMNEKLINRTGKNAVGEFCYKVLHDRDSVCPWCVNERVFAGETVRWEVQSPKDGRWYYVVNAPIRNADGSMSKQSMIMDTTERKVAEEERKTTIEFLSLVNACTGTQDLLSAAATFFQQRSGCEAVGFRLKERDEHPLGGNFICGGSKTSRPNFSSGGSLWTNSKTELLDDSTKTDRDSRTPSRCNGEAYESTVLIPLDVGQERLGLLQLNDRRKGLFSPEVIELWERLAGYLAVALAKCRSEDALRMAKEELRRSHEELEKRIAERTEQLEKTVDALRTSEERYAVAVQGSNDGIWDLNLATGEIFFSPRWKSMLGYEDDEIPNNFEEWKRRIHQEDRHLVMDSRNACLDGHIPAYEIEYRLQHKDGSFRWIHARGICQRDSEGKPTRFSGSHTDITDRKMLERQLLQSQKMESVGILAGGVAHDFNNLLTAISGYGQILLESISEDDERSRESIGNVLKAADRAAELTSALLAFSRKQLISPKPVHIDSLISDTSKIIQRIIGEDIEFSANFTGKNLLVKADPGQIEQVLMNLATNSRDAMPTGGHLSITTRQVVVEEGAEKLYDLPSPGKYALISVADTGTGIDKETLESIFEPFYTTKEVGKGTGLGLSIVHGIIKQHSGSILASSEPGKGTRFDIYLPLIKGHAVKEELPFITQHPGGTETLLVAEDDETVRMFIKRILERVGYKVIIAEDGEEAVARFRENDDISLVLSDVVMPRKNGREMLDEIKKIKPGIKGVFISGYTAEVIQKKGMLEDTEFITKPFKRERLLQKIREVLDKTSSSGVR